MILNRRCDIKGCTNRAVTVADISTLAQYAPELFAEESSVLEGGAYLCFEHVQQFFASQPSPTVDSEHPTEPPEQRNPADTRLLASRLRYALREIVQSCKQHNARSVLDEGFIREIIDVLVFLESEHYHMEQLLLETCVQLAHSGLIGVRPEIESLYDRISTTLQPPNAVQGE